MLFARRASDGVGVMSSFALEIYDDTCEEKMLIYVREKKSARESVGVRERAREREGERGRDRGRQGERVCV